MEKNYVRIKSITKITHDTIRVVVDKPSGFVYLPGQATAIAIDKEGLENQKRPFTFSSTPDDQFLEFIIKVYPEHDGTTDKLLTLNSGDRLILGPVFGSITYKGEGIFIAGGSGVTPFISIFKNLDQNGMLNDNKLIFANKREIDIILKDDLEEMFGDNFINILSEENNPKYHHGFITRDFLEKMIPVGFSNYFYLCGPPQMMVKVTEYLDQLGVKKSQIVKEVF